MSAIYNFWECEHCGHAFSQYVSFGHPSRPFCYRWACPECGKFNDLHVPQLSYDEGVMFGIEDEAPIEEAVNICVMSNVNQAR